MYLDRAKQKFSDFCQDTRSYYSLEGCSEVDIKKLEETLKCDFPSSYKEFLKWMGKDSGKFMDSYFFRLSNLEQNKVDALELMQEDEYEESLPEDAIIFAWGSQYFDFFFIRCCEGEDPPLHNYWQGQGIFWNVFPSIEEFVIHYINSLIKSHTRRERFIEELTN
jgi:hypothetical protein